MSRKHRPTNEVVQDDDLIKVKVIKKKHFDQLLDTLHTHGVEPKFSEDQVEFLYYAKNRDVVLCRARTTGTCERCAP
jgi:hypothetical protein